MGNLKEKLSRPFGKKKPSICILTLAYPGKTSPVHGVFLENQAKALKNLGYRPVVVAPRTFLSDPLYARQKGIPIYRFPYLSGNRRLSEYKRIPLFSLITFFLSGFRQALKAIDKEKCALIHAHWVIPTGLLGLLVAKKTGLPLITTAHGSDINLYARKNRFFFRLASLVLKKSNLVIAVSSSLQTKILKEFGLPENKVRKLPIGIDSQIYCPRSKAKIRKRLRIPTGRKIILFAGGLTPNKGFETLKAAFPEVLKKYPEAILFVLGNLPADKLKEVKRKIKKEGWDKNIRFLGEKKPSQMSLFLNAADIVAIPSFQEGLGQTALESLACDTPVVASATGDLPLILKFSGGGKTFEPGNALQLASQIISLLKEKKREISKEFLKKEFDLKANAQKLAQIYNSLLTTDSPYQPDYYERLIKEYKRESRWSKNRIKNVLRLASPFKEKIKVLDLGCGVGIFALEFSRLGAEVSGVDLSSQALKAASKLFFPYHKKKQPSLFQADVTSLPFKKDQFDLVVCADLVEHLYPKEFLKMLKEVRRVLKPGGKILIYTPCPTHLFEIMRSRNFILKRDKSHIDLKAPGYLAKILKNEDFLIEKFYFVPSHLPLFNLLEKVLMLFPVIGKFFRRRTCLLARKT